MENGKMSNKYNWLPIVEKARKTKSITFEELKIICLARWDDELAKLKTTSSIIPSAEYYKGYREALRDVMGDLRIKYSKMTYRTEHKKSKGFKIKNAR